MMLTAIGLMSGTSLDGVDVALIETDGKRVKCRRLIEQATYPAHSDECESEANAGPGKDRI